MSEFSDDIIRGLRQALDIARGERPSVRLHLPAPDGRLATAVARATAKCTQCEAAWIGPDAERQAADHAAEAAHTVDVSFHSRIMSGSQG